MSLPIVPPPTDDSATKVWVDLGEHKARIKLGLGCHLQGYGSDCTCGCAMITAAMMKRGDPAGVRVMKAMAERAGYEMVEHQDAVPEPVEFDDFDLLEFPEQTPEALAVHKQRANVKRSRSQDEKQPASDSNIPAKLRKKPPRATKLDPNAPPFKPSSK